MAVLNLEFLWTVFPIIFLSFGIAILVFIYYLGHKKGHGILKCALIAIIAVSSYLLLAQMLWSGEGVAMPSPIEQGAIIGSETSEIMDTLKSDYSEEFPDLADVEMVSEFVGSFGKIREFRLADLNGDAIGSLAVNSSSGEIRYIENIGHEWTCGGDKLSLMEAKEITGDYASRWGFKLTDSYVMEDYHINCRGEGTQGRLWEYVIIWTRKYDNVFLPNSFLVSMDAIDGTMIYCSFPCSSSPMPNKAEDLKPHIDKDEALNKAKGKIKWQRSILNSIDGVDVHEEAHLRYVFTDKGPILIWDITIAYIGIFLRYYRVSVNAYNGELSGVI